MARYTHLNLKEDVEDQAPKFDMSPDMEFRSARVPLEMEPNGYNRRYLQTKREKLNHVFENL